MPGVVRVFKGKKIITVHKFMGYYVHALNCQDSEKCTMEDKKVCQVMKDIMKHWDECEDEWTCTYMCCRATRRVMYHWQECNDDQCPLCKRYLMEGYGTQ